ncbi:Acid proteinase [Pleurostoma richardsiae]|uniref:Acid proteinase n=1 Tax=Pleurostoma richardsiae TaxID=41990 RepID=A0AA38R9A0_9PEZI|nr:Acid proteinase [Pleurostoma richardsiae]
MKFTTVSSAILFAGVALGARFTEERRARAARRAEAAVAPRPGSGLPRLPVVPSVEADAIEGNNTANVEYSSNWAGAVLIGSGYKSVTGTFVVPTPKAPSGGNSGTQYAASAWVGIDGDTATNSILQTGVDFYVENGQVSYDAWYEWYPDYAYTFSGFSISTGDTIRVTVTATTTSSGTALVENLTTGKKVTHSFSGQSRALQELNAEWIVEDFSEGNSLVPFANFGTVTFTDSEATTSSSTVGPEGATIIDIKQNNKVLTSASVSGDDVTITYVG